MRAGNILNEQAVTPLLPKSNSQFCCDASRTRSKSVVEASARRKTMFDTVEMI